VKRKIAVVTSSRADYGLLFWLMREIADDLHLQLQVIATGMHMSPEFGLTYRMIEQDGFEIDAKVEILLSSDSSVGVVKSMGLANIAFADALERLSPDIVVVLGDRFETLSVAQTSFILKIPVAHIHGGEITEGALDDSIRHAITKLSHIHFPVAQKYYERILQLGESPDFVYNFGAPGLDHIKRTRFLTHSELSSALSLQFFEFNILVTYHPPTAKNKNLDEGIKEIFKALEHYPNASIIFTESNADEAGRKITKLIKQFVSKDEIHRFSFTALGLTYYLSLAKIVDVVLGNSSSGLIEVPFVGTPTINIGDRQKNRLQASSVINCEEKCEAILCALKTSQSKDFKEVLSNIYSPYGNGDVSQKIKKVLKEISLDNIIQKRFYTPWKENELAS